MLYSYAKLSNHDFGLFRLLGPGLGNLLFPWARSIIASEKYDLTQIPTTWPQIKLGTIFRRELDKRMYSDLFKSPDESFPLSRKLRLLYFARKLNEEQLGNIPHPVNCHGKDTVFLFSGMKNGFSDLAGHNKVVLNTLINIVKDKHLEGYRRNLSNGICMHIRLGDFVTGGHGTTPISWYVSLAEIIRDLLGQIIPIYVFTDGRDEEISEVLRLNNVERLSFGSSIADLFALSNARILLASSGSTFSGWASYLGESLSIWPKDSRKHGLENTTNKFLEIDKNETISNEFKVRVLETWNY